MKKIAVFGGSFNPPHIGHVLVATYTAMTGGFDEVLAIPTFAHPDGKNLLDFHHRFKMCQLAFGHIPNVIVDPVESTLTSPSFSVNTLGYLSERFPAEYRFVVGADILQNTNKWTDIDKVFRLAKPFPVGRLGYPTPDTLVEMPGVSSTDVRKLLWDSRYGKELEQIVPRNVLDYIKENNLYNEEVK